LHSPGMKMTGIRWWMSCMGVFAAVVTMAKRRSGSPAGSGSQMPANASGAFLLRWMR
jgi:hypothetical protein